MWLSQYLGYVNSVSGFILTPIFVYCYVVMILSCIYFLFEMGIHMNWINIFHKFYLPSQIFPMLYLHICYPFLKWRILYLCLLKLFCYLYPISPACANNFELFWCLSIFTNLTNVVPDVADLISIPSTLSLKLLMKILRVYWRKGDPALILMASTWLHFPNW